MAIAKLTPFQEIMQRLERVGKSLEAGKMEVQTANAIAGAARTWLSGVNTALRVQKLASPEGKALMDGLQTSKSKGK